MGYLGDRQGREAPRGVAPAGKYAVQLVKLELAETKRGDQVVKAQFKRDDGKGSFFDQFMKSGNPKAVHIGMERLDAMAHAMGVQTYSRTEDLEGRSLVVEVIVDKNPDYGEQNRIRRFLKAGSDVGQTPPPPQRTAPPPQPQWTKQPANTAVDPGHVPDDDMPFW